MVSNVLRAHDRQLLPPHRQRPAGPPEHGRVGHLRAGQRVPGPARLRRPERRPDPARRAGQFQQRFPARDLPGLDLQGRRRAGRQHRSHRAGRTRPAAASSSLLRLDSTRASCGRIGHVTTALEAAIANYELAFRMQSAVPELIDLPDESAGDRGALRPRRSLPDDADLRPRVPDRPAAGRAAACGSSS